MALRDRVDRERRELPNDDRHLLAAGDRAADLERREFGQVYRHDRRGAADREPENNCRWHGRSQTQDVPLQTVRPMCAPQLKHNASGAAPRGVRAGFHRWGVSGYPPQPADLDRLDSAGADTCVHDGSALR
jgi:hypothetical protein